MTHPKVTRIQSIQLLQWITKHYAALAAARLTLPQLVERVHQELGFTCADRTIIRAFDDLSLPRVHIRNPQIKQRKRTAGTEKIMEMHRTVMSLPVLFKRLNEMDERVKQLDSIVTTLTNSLEQANRAYHELDVRINTYAKPTSSPQKTFDWKPVESFKDLTSSVNTN